MLALNCGPNYVCTLRNLQYYAKVDIAHCWRIICLDKNQASLCSVLCSTKGRQPQFRRRMLVSANDFVM